MLQMEMAFSDSRLTGCSAALLDLQEEARDDGNSTMVNVQPANSHMVS